MLKTSRQQFICEAVYMNTFKFCQLFCQLCYCSWRNYCSKVLRETQTRTQLLFSIRMLIYLLHEGKNPCLVKQMVMEWETQEEKKKNLGVLYGRVYTLCPSKLDPRKFPGAFTRTWHLMNLGFFHPLSTAVIRYWNLQLEDLLFACVTAHDLVTSARTCQLQSEEKESVKGKRWLLR